MPFKRRFKDKYAGSWPERICCPNSVRLVFFSFFSFFLFLIAHVNQLSNAHTRPSISCTHLRPKFLTFSAWRDAAPWSAHPCGLSLIESVMRHLVAQSDIQTLSMISCAFGNVKERKSCDSGM